MADSIIEKVQAKYGAAARSSLSSENTGVRAVAEAFGYSAAELASIPAEANLGLSCGNPTAFASLKPGETVVDLGCGAGLDVLLAAPKVGPSGRAVGIDMTPDMIERAKSNAKKQRLTNVEFHLSTIDKLPLVDASADCIISNCVINLAPDKRQVFREMFRVLKAGGRVAVSDIALKKPLPSEIGESIMAYVGCIAGAILIDEYESWLREAGFNSVQIIDTRKDLNAYSQIENQTGCCSPAQTRDSGLAIVSSCCSTESEGGTSVHDDLAKILEKYNVNDYAASVQVYAVKGGRK